MSAESSAMKALRSSIVAKASCLAASEMAKEFEKKSRSLVRWSNSLLKVVATNA
jgi:hypothetical protein